MHIEQLGIWGILKYNCLNSAITATGSPPDMKSQVGLHWPRNTSNCKVMKTNRLDQRDRTRRASLQYQHFNYLSYLGRSGSFLQSRIYIMKVVQYPWNEKNILPPMGFEPQSPSMWTWNTTLRPTSKLYPLQDIYMYLDLKRVIKLPKESLRVFSLCMYIIF